MNTGLWIAEERRATARAEALGRQLLAFRGDERLFLKLLKETLLAERASGDRKHVYWNPSMMIEATYALQISELRTDADGRLVEAGKLMTFSRYLFDEKRADGTRHVNEDYVEHAINGTALALDRSRLDVEGKRLKEQALEWLREQGAEV